MLKIASVCSSAQNPRKSLHGVFLQGFSEVPGYLMETRKIASAGSSAQNPGKSSAGVVFARVFEGPRVPGGNLKNNPENRQRKDFAKVFGGPSIEARIRRSGLQHRSSETNIWALASEIWALTLEVGNWKNVSKPKRSGL